MTRGLMDDYLHALLSDDEDHSTSSAKAEQTQAGERAWSAPTDSRRTQSSPARTRPVAKVEATDANSADLPALRSRPLARHVDANAVADLTELEAIQRRRLQALLDPLGPLSTPPVPAKPEAKHEQPGEAISADKSEEKATADEATHSDQTFASEPLPSPSEAAPTVISPLLAWGENGRPAWAQQGFDALLFDVSGLTLAVPLIALGQIYPLTSELTPLFGQAEWFLGLQPTAGGSMRVVDTARFVMPERYRAEQKETLRYVISIEGLNWGLAVDQVRQPVRLAPEDVTWRSQRSKRPWLAGTVKSAMCALLDIPQMGECFAAANRGHGPSKGR